MNIKISDIAKQVNESSSEEQITSVSDFII